MGYEGLNRSMPLFTFQDPNGKQHNDFYNFMHNGEFQFPEILLSAEDFARIPFKPTIRRQDGPKLGSYIFDIFV